MSDRARVRTRVLQAHAVLTAAAGVVLVVRPAAIPGIVGIQLAPDAYLLGYLLAAAELGFAALSWRGARLVDPDAVRVIIFACVVLHAFSAALETVVWISRPSPILMANIAIRVAVVAVLLWIRPAP
jgi:hypothetical protein